MRTPLPYITRIVDPLVSEYLSGLPAVMLVGQSHNIWTTTRAQLNGDWRYENTETSPDVLRADSREFCLPFGFGR